MSGIGGRVLGRVGGVLEVLLREEEDVRTGVERDEEERENEERENDERVSCETHLVFSVFWLKEEEEERLSETQQFSLV